MTIVKSFQTLAIAACTLLASVNVCSHSASTSDIGLPGIKAGLCSGRDCLNKSTKSHPKEYLINFSRQQKISRFANNNQSILAVNIKALPASLEYVTSEHSTDETTESIKLRPFRILLLASAFSFVALTVAAFTNRIVVFYDWKDLINTLMIFLSVIVGLLLVGFFDGDGTMQFVMLWATTIAVIYYCFKTLKSSIINNNSFFLGSVVGLFKIFISATLAILVFGKIGELIDKKGTSGTRFVSMLFLGLFMYILNMFVNGERVKERRAELAEQRKTDVPSKCSVNTHTPVAINLEIEEEIGETTNVPESDGRPTEANINAARLRGQQVGRETIKGVLEKLLNR